MAKTKPKGSLRKAYDNLPSSIINTAQAYPQGRNIIIGILMRETNRKAIEVVNYLKEHDKGICKLEEYIIHDKSRSK